MQINQQGPTDGERVQRIRRRALLESPHSFGATLEEHDSGGEKPWRRLLSFDRAAFFIASSEDDDIGMVMGWAFRERENACGLFGLWVDPNVRRENAGEMLVEALADWARQKGFSRLILDVGDENDAAIGLYDRCGFERTGLVSTLPDPRHHITEHERERIL